MTKADGQETPKEEWQAEEVPDEYSDYEPIVYSVHKSLDRPTFWFRDEAEATGLADYLNSLEQSLLREREEKEALQQRIDIADIVASGIGKVMNEADSRVERLQTAIGQAHDRAIDIGTELDDWKRRAEQAEAALALAEQRAALGALVTTDRQPATETMKEYVTHWFADVQLWTHPEGRPCRICSLQPPVEGS